MTLTVKLDPQEQIRLQQLIVALNVGNQSDAIRKLINDRFVELQADLTFVERRGGHPKHLLHGASNLSAREARKAAVAEVVAAKAARRRTK